MKLNFTFCWLVLFVAPLGLSQEELTTHFPDDFFGIYTGILQISSPNGNRSIAMEFHLQPTDTLGQYQYKLYYGKGY